MQTTVSVSRTLFFSPFVSSKGENKLSQKSQKDYHTYDRKQNK